MANFGQYFLAGFLLADVFVADWGGETGAGNPVWDVVWVAAGALAFAAAARPAVAGLLLPPVLFVLCVAALRGRYVRSLLRNRWVTACGGMCYSIYLLHVPLISLAGRATMRLAAGDFLTDFVVQLVLLAVPTVLVSGVFFRLVERPCMDRNWPRKFWAAVRGPKP